MICPHRRLYLNEVLRNRHEAPKVQSQVQSMAVVLARLNLMMILNLMEMIHLITLIINHGQWREPCNAFERLREAPLLYLLPLVNQEGLVDHHQVLSQKGLEIGVCLLHVMNLYNHHQEHLH